MDKFAKQNKVRKLPGYCGVNDADIWDEGYKSYRGRSHGRVDVFFFRKHGVKPVVSSQQKS
jgi:hypothetical protein